MGTNGIHVRDIDNPDNVPTQLWFKVVWWCGVFLWFIIFIWGMRFGWEVEIGWKGCQ